MVQIGVLEEFDGFSKFEWLQNFFQKVISLIVCKKGGIYSVNAMLLLCVFG